MEFDFFSAIELREGLMVVVVLLMIYIAYVYLRMQRLKREALRIDTAAPVFAATAAVAAYSAEQGAGRAEQRGTKIEEAAAVHVESDPGELGSSEFQFPWNEPAPAVASSEAQRVAILENDVEQLRKEVGGLRAEILMLREAVQRAATPPPPPPPKEVPRQPSVAELIAPQYSEAMQLARKEVDPGAISQQCGITRAEAELVAALVRNRDN